MRDGLIAHAIEGALGGAFGTLFVQRAQRAGRRIPIRTEQIAPVTGPRWFHGAAAGVLLGLAADRLERRRVVRRGSAAGLLLTGAAVGAAVWAVRSSGLLPSGDVARPLRERGAAQVAVSLLTHLAFGAVSSLPILVMERFVRPEPWWRRALSSLAGRSAP